MNNVLTVAELKRRGMAAIEEGLQRGPVHIVKRNKPSAVVLSEDEYQRLTGGKASVTPGPRMPRGSYWFRVRWRVMLHWRMVHRANVAIWACFARCVQCIRGRISFISHIRMLWRACANKVSASKMLLRGVMKC